MKLLVLGGTRFVGRHVVDAALACGDEVTTFTRGRRPALWQGRVTVLTGDRDPSQSPGLAALATDDTWDAVIDTSGYVPRVVGASATLLAGRVERYVFVSSVSVYADASASGLDETAPVGSLDEPGTEDVGKHYGPLKVACENEVSRIFGARAINVRPGLIVGPHDSTDRFGYWVARFVHPHLLGTRSRQALVPLPHERPLQFIDARDLARWLRQLAATGAGGTYNASSPAGSWTFATLVDALHGAAAGGASKAAWVDEKTIEAYKMTPWTGLPLWIPTSFADMAGFMQIDCSKAQRAGLRMRALAEIVGDTAAWLAQRDNAAAWKDVLTAGAEREILAAAGVSP